MLYHREVLANFNLKFIVLTGHFYAPNPAETAASRNEELRHNLFTMVNSMSKKVASRINQVQNTSSTSRAFQVLIFT